MRRSDRYLGFGEQPEWKESLKRAMPQLVHLARLGRLMANQVRYPVAATLLDWNGTVVNGPFQGMRYARSGKGNFPETLGTYEQCLHPVIERVIRNAPRLIIDVGAAYGYYALGLAYRCPGSHVIAYEMDATRADLIRKYRRVNALDDRLDIRGQCTSALLSEDLRHAPGAFVLVDVEGIEDELLQPDISNIPHSEMLVELHEMFVPGVTERLKDRFAATHRSEIIKQDTVCSCPTHLHRSVRRYWHTLAVEFREQMEWLHLVPRDS